MQFSCVVSGGQGVIDIISDGFANCLATSWASALDWPDCGGSVARYYALSVHTPAERRALSRALDDALAAGDETRIEQAIPEFLQLFTDGTYWVWTLEFGRERGSYDVTEYEYYPSALNYLALTQSPESLDRERVAHYEASIRDGGRPKILCYRKDFIDSPVLEGPDFYGGGHLWSSPFYVLDGHHKLAAYRALAVPPELVVIRGLADDGPRAYETGKPALFEQAEVILSRDLERLHHLVSNAPRMLISGEPWVERYNAVLDAALRERRWPRTELFELFQQAFRSNDKKCLAWLVARLQALRERLEQGKETRLAYPRQGRWVTYSLRSAHDFDVWCMLLFASDFATLLERVRER